MQSGSDDGAQVRRVRLAVLTLAVIAIPVVVWSVTSPKGSSESLSFSPPGGCVAAPGARQSDIDEEDTPEDPWPHTPGQKVTVHFEIGDLSPRYASFVRRGAEIWSRSPCIEALAIGKCPDGANCSTVRTAERSSDQDTDGESDSNDRNGVRVSNSLTFYTGLLDESSDNGALATVVHEMGHALGLMHRNDPDSVMNAETDDKTDPVPDATDFANLVVIYGGSEADR